MTPRGVAVVLLFFTALPGAGEALAARARSAELAPPTVEGPLYKGATLRCNAPAVDAIPWITWQRDGALISGAGGDTYLISGADVGHRLACVATVTTGGVLTTATSAEVQILHVATTIFDRSPHTQRGPTLRLRGYVSADGPVAAGQVLLVARGVERDVVVARTTVDTQGGYVLDRTIRALVPGRVPFRLDFVPADPELHAPAEQAVTLKALSPLTYPFPRVVADRHAVFADGLVPFWSDGSVCAVGCRPSDVVSGWPLKPFHEQHALRAGLNERRLSGFHVGIDIMTAAPQAIYAIQSGYAHILHAGDEAARVRVGNYIYWHVDLRVHEGQYIHAYDTVLGYTLRWMRHLHLSEVAGSDDSYLNPLRPGGRVLAPWSDTEPPVIGPPVVGRDGNASVEVFDPQSFVQKIYYETPVLAPAAVAYRLFRADGAAIGRLEWALRGSRWLPNALASLVFTPGAHSPGFLCFARNVVCKPVWRYRLAGGLAPQLPLHSLHGRVRLTVYAWDWAGNATARDTWLRP
jgi:hypothetical protein